MSQNETIFSAAALDVHASGNTADIPCGNDASLAVDLNLSAFTGGASPSVTFTVQRKDAQGNYNPMGSGAALTAAGYQQLDVGPGLPINRALTSIFRLAWVTAGAPTAVTCAVSIIGRT